MINLKRSEWHYDEENAKVVIKPWGREVWINFYSVVEMLLSGVNVFGSSQAKSIITL